MTPVTQAWTDLGDGIRVRQSRVYWMNSVALLDRDHTVLVDPGVLPSELDDLAARVAETGPERVTLIMTHGDWDHVLGRPWWPEAAIVAHDGFAAQVRERSASILEKTRAAVERAGERWERGFEPVVPTRAVSGLRFEKIGPWRVVLRDADGHSATMLSTHLPERRLLIAADLLSDIEIPMVKTSVAAYRKTLEELVPLVEHGAIETLVPGHGAIARTPDEVMTRLTRDLHYLEGLEHGVRQARSRGLSIEETVQALETMEYTGKHADYSMVDDHRRNVRLAFEQSVLGPASNGGSSRAASGRGGQAS